MDKKHLKPSKFKHIHKKIGGSQNQESHKKCA